MLLSEYIESLKELFEQIGDTDMLYTSKDDEGNGYNRVNYSPELRCLSPHEDNDYRPDGLLSLKEDDETLEEYLDNNCLDEDDETLEEYLDNNCLDEEDLPNLRTVILL